MDSITQAALGAAVGQVVLGKKIGNKKALLFGAIAGTIPDLDVFLPYSTTLEYVRDHRGISHSIVFAVLGGAIFAYIFYKFFDKNKKARFRDWYLMTFLGFFTHALLDCFTTWGTQLFLPFSDMRIGFQSVYIVDFFYTIPLIVGIIIAYGTFKQKLADKAIIISLIISTFYLFFGVGVKLYAGTKFEQALVNQNIEYTNYMTTVTPLNTFLWGVVAETEDGYYVGDYSIFDDDDNISFLYLPKNHEILKEALAGTNIPEVIAKISKGYYTVEQHEDQILVNDLRYSKLSGYEDIASDFTFRYLFTLVEGEYQMDSIKYSDKKLDGQAPKFIKRVFGYK